MFYNNNTYTKNSIRIKNWKEFSVEEFFCSILFVSSYVCIYVCFYVKTSAIISIALLFLNGLHTLWNILLSLVTMFICQSVNCLHDCKIYNWNPRCSQLNEKALEVIFHSLYVAFQNIYFNHSLWRNCTNNTKDNE